MDHILKHILSTYERDILLKNPAQAPIYMSCGSDILNDIFDCRFSDLGYYSPVSREVASEPLIKKPTGYKKLSGSVDALQAWNNVVLAIIRAFDMIPGTPVITALTNVAPDMMRFISDRHYTEPHLATNQFCPLYLNYLLQHFSRTFGQPTSTHQDITVMVKGLRVGVNTDIYQLTKAQLDHDLRIQVDHLLTAPTRPPSKSSGQDKKSTAASKTGGGRPICFLKYTTTGCNKPPNKCKFEHLTNAPTDTQKTTIRDYIKAANNRNPNKTPLVAAFGTP